MTAEPEPRATAPDEFRAAQAALFLAIDEATVALDFLHNLLAPTGHDVEARRSTGWLAKSERAHNPPRLQTLLSGLRSKGEDDRLRMVAIPQGDQMRRTRDAITLAIGEINRALAHDHPESAADIWRELIATHRSLDLAHHGAALLVTREHPRVSSDEVTSMTRALNASISSLARARSQLELVQIRSEP